MRHFADLVRADAPNDELRAAAQSLLDMLEEAIAANGSALYPTEQHQGVSIYYPLVAVFETPHLALQFAADTSWDEFLRVSPTSEAYVADAFEPDDVWSQANVVALSEDHGRHWCHRSGDEDWLAFMAEAGRRYVIATEHLGPEADTEIALFSSDGVTLLAQDYDSGCEPKASLIAWTAATDGSHFVGVQQQTFSSTPSCYGSRTYYDVFVCALSFSDMAATQWALRWVESCAKAGIVYEYWDGSYRPAETVTRAQMAVYIARGLAGSDGAVPPGPITPSFPDVPDTHWAYRYIEYVREAGVVGGYGDGYYPDRRVDRAQMAVYVSRAVAGGEAHVPDDADGTPFFPDVPMGHWAYRYIEYAHDHGIADGYWDGYRPGDPVTRD